MMRVSVTGRRHGVPHVLWYGWTPRLAMLWGVVAGRGRRTPHIPSPNDILFTNDAVDPKITDPLAKLFNHRLTHQAHPPQAFANLTLSRPVEFTLIIFDIWFVLFVCRKAASGNPFPGCWEVPHQNRDVEVLRGDA